MSLSVESTTEDLQPSTMYITGWWECYWKSLSQFENFIRVHNLCCSRQQWKAMTVPRKKNKSTAVMSCILLLWKSSYMSDTWTHSRGIFSQQLLIQVIWKLGINYTLIYALFMQKKKKSYQTVFCKLMWKSACQEILTKILLNYQTDCKI